MGELPTGRALPVCCHPSGTMPSMSSICRATACSIVGFAILLGACSDDKSSSGPIATPVASPTATTLRTESTATPAFGTKGYPRGTRTGNVDVDPVLAAIETGTPDALRGIVRYVSPPCVAQRPQGIGPVAVCPAGVAPGTPVDEFPSALGEGTYIDRKDFEANPRLPGVGDQVYAIVRQPHPTTEPGFPKGDYIVYFTGGPIVGQLPQLYVASGKVVLACWLCGTPQADLQRPGLQFILPPP